MSTEKVVYSNEGINTLQSGNSNNGGDISISLSARAGMETANNLAVHNGWAPVSLTEIISWADICKIREDEEVIPVFVITFQEAFGFWFFHGAFEQPDAEIFDSLVLRLELWW